MTSSYLCIGVLDCDIPVPNVYAKRGLYRDIFGSLLRDAASKTEKFSDVEIEIKGYDTIREQYPSAEELSGLNAIIITGSAAAAYDNIPWVITLTEFCKKLYTSYPKIKLFGSCFGHQILCHSLFSSPGKSVVSLDPKGFELGVQSITLSDTFLSEFGPVTSNSQTPNQLRLQFVHSDHVTISRLPEGFHPVGSSNHCAFQGVWKSGQVLTFQGHAEFDKFVNRETLKAFRKPDWDDAYLGRWLKAVERDDDAVWAATVMLKFFLEDVVTDKGDNPGRKGNLVESRIFREKVNLLVDEVGGTN